MKNFLKITTLMAAVLTPVLGFSQETSSIDVSAKVDAGCFLEANNINFGTVFAPLSAQAVSSNINVLCSKNANVKIDLIYGGANGVAPVQGVVVGSDVYTLHSHRSGDIILAKNGVQMTGDGSYNIRCSSSGVFFDKKIEPFLQAIGYNLTYTGNWIKDTKGVCNTNQGSYTSTFLSQIGGVVTTYGKMLGGNNEILAYNISLPNDNSKVWITGLNAYSLLTTGTSQEIPINAKLIPANSSGSFMSAGSYSDILTVSMQY